MADQSQRQQYARGSNTRSFVHKLQVQSPNSTQLIGFMTLVISSGFLLLLTGLTLTVTVLGLIFFTPLIFISSPIWVPVGTIIFIVIAGFLSFSGFGIGAVVVISWLYKYFRGFHPAGSNRVDYARSRIADTASHMKDYAREYGEYWQRKAKDASPGA
ncbi:unnamed protein product [Fraxinus pennsylvanica]|uniref:Oleosin n=1 Tax=Fraxinus pennsylvanica TaxID=56036 RepID=A0AAD2EE32_9LAMI|nr:unnamed protein product [Fraxinus pennsylvanica]